MYLEAPECHAPAASSGSVSSGVPARAQTVDWMRFFCGRFRPDISRNCISHLSLSLSLSLRRLDQERTSSGGGAFNYAVVLHNLLTLQSTGRSQFKTLTVSATVQVISRANIQTQCQVVNIRLQRRSGWGLRSSNEDDAWEIIRESSRIETKPIMRDRSAKH